MSGDEEPSDDGDGVKTTVVAVVLAVTVMTVSRCWWW